MRLSSQNSSFIFSLPTDFASQAVIERYEPLMEKNHVPYQNVIDYLSSTIKEISSPGLSISTPTQRIKRGKELDFKPVTNINDIVASRELDITFRSVDSDINYWILYDIFTNKYMDTENLYSEPFILQAIDIHRDVIYQINFRQIILKTLSEQRFSYNDQLFTEKQFTMTFSFNFYDIEFMLDNSKILASPDSELPTIVQKIGRQF